MVLSSNVCLIHYERSTHGLLLVLSIPKPITIHMASVGKGQTTDRFILCAGPKMPYEAHRWQRRSLRMCLDWAFFRYHKRRKMAIKILEGACFQSGIYFKVKTDAETFITNYFVNSQI
jgi:hypothetical protein